ncbi:MAG: hypothetical protein ACT6FC_07645, partial [Methanosarcinaceae archaeon]
NSTKVGLGKYLSKYGGYTNNENEALVAKSDFLSREQGGVCMQGSGKLADGRIIKCATVDEAFEWGADDSLDFVRSFETVARCQWSTLLNKGDNIWVDADWFNDILRKNKNSNGFLEVTDVGQAPGLCNSSGHEGIDVYMGVGQDALDSWRDFINVDSYHEVMGTTYWPIYRVEP